MRNITIMFLLVCVASCVARDLVIGTSYGTKLAWRIKVNAMAFPFKKRVKEIFYSNSEQIPIRKKSRREDVISLYICFVVVKKRNVSYDSTVLATLIWVRDLDRIEDSMESVTAGGVGFPYANVRLKGARGQSLNYQVEIYI